MSAAKDPDGLGPMALVGALLGSTLFVLVSGLFAAADGGFDPMFVPMVLYAWFWGMLIALLTAFPVGLLCGWIVTLDGGRSQPRAALAGALTGVLLTTPLGVPQVFVLGFLLLGAFSGWAAYRLLTPAKISWDD